MNCIQTIEKLIEWQETQIAMDKQIDKKLCELIINLSQTYIKEQASLITILSWLVKDTRARFDKEQGVKTGKGSYSQKLKKAMAIIGGEWK